MVELKGSLGTVGLPSIVHLVGELHQSGRLELRNGASEAVLGFADGRLVAADFDREQGLNALAACVVAFADGDFAFIEGAVPGERTIDLGPQELRAHLAQLATPNHTPEAIAPRPVVAEEDAPLETCPRLGFADDPSRHYSRPTALHRCYASGSSSLVTSQEQRELCLAGRYSTCPRFRGAPAQVLPAAPAPVQAGMPTVVTARLEPSTQLRLAPPEQDAAVPPWIGQRTPEPEAPPRSERPSLRRIPRRVLLLVAGGAVLGLAVLAAAVLVGTRLFNPGFAPKAASVAPAFEAVPTVQRAPTVASRPSPVATTAPTANPVSRPPTPTGLPLPTVGVSRSALIDVRFAVGAPKEWRDNEPFAGWSDGAYRLQARHAARFVAVAAPLDKALGDIVLSGTFRKTGGPPGGGYGLVLRDAGPEPRDGVNQDMNAYVFEAGDLGEVGVWRRDLDHWVDLLPWTRSASVRPGGSPNDLVVRAIGDRFSFSVNGIEVAAIQDDSLRAGGVGVFVGGDYNEVALDRFVVQVLD